MDILKTICCAFLLTISALSYAGSVNINVADADAIADGLSGIGMSKASLLVKYRDKHGPFTSVDDIVLVKGIGQRTVELNRDRIVVE